MINVTLAQARQFILQKNYLTARQASDLPQLVEDIAALPADPFTTPFLAARVRLANFSPGDLLTALGPARLLLKNSLMRSAPFIIEADHYPTFYVATARQRNKDFNAEFRLWGIEHNAEIEALGDLIAPMVNDAPLSAETIMMQLPVGSVKRLTQSSRGGRVTETTNVALTLRWLAANGRLYAANLSTDWRSESPIYGLMSDWYPDLDLTAVPGEAEAQKTVVHRYLTAFGPATEADVSFWTGFGKSETARAIGALSGEMTLVMVQGSAGILLLLKSQIDALKGVELPTEPVINVLPADDPFVTAHRASRARYFSDQTLQRRVFNSAGAAKPTILVSGQIVGLWGWDQSADQPLLTWQLLTEVDPAVMPLIGAEIERMAEFVGAGGVQRED
ncbi:MAG: AlkZ family DNA glycosylase [Anaerolineaceae bacterium]|nr:AlkZ family DNA glycosylase [Anaerolineaceae bacterium]MCB9101902.1 AlkZ family DNA glycosylase [Anaerolineales bacterium]